MGTDCHHAVGVAELLDLSGQGFQRDIEAVWNVALTECHRISDVNDRRGVVFEE